MKPLHLKFQGSIRLKQWISYCQQIARFPAFTLAGWCTGTA